MIIAYTAKVVKWEIGPRKKKEKPPPVSEGGGRTDFAAYTNSRSND